MHYENHLGLRRGSLETKWGEQKMVPSSSPSEAESSRGLSQFRRQDGKAIVGDQALV
jgi:hypothetical protein